MSRNFIFKRISSLIQHKSLTKPNLNPQFLNIRRCRTLTSKNCWKCGSNLKNPQNFFCENCETIQKPTEAKNYFKLFNLPEDYDVDTTNLRKTYRTLQSVLHPDKFTNKSEEEKKISEEVSSLLNKGYNTLQTPLDRALHILYLNGGKIGEDNRTDNPEFLSEMMELNEELEDADSEGKLRSIEKKNREVIGNVSREISKAFKEGNIDEAKRVIIRMKYYESLSKRIHELLREKGIVD